MVRPANQLQLSEAEMKEEHTRVLTANDPNGRAMFHITQNGGWTQKGCDVTAVLFHDCFPDLG